MFKHLLCALSLSVCITMKPNLEPYIARCFILCIKTCKCTHLDPRRIRWDQGSENFLTFWHTLLQPTKQNWKQLGLFNLFKSYVCSWQSCIVHNCNWFHLSLPGETLMLSPSFCFHLINDSWGRKSQVIAMRKRMPERGEGGVAWW